MADQPLEVLEAAAGTLATVRLKGGESMSGVLVGYDQHMNLVLDPPDGVDVDPEDDRPATVVGDTTVIRGDNVVTIET